MADEMRYIESELQKTVLNKRVIMGRVLDVGGGGEGIVGLLYGKNTVAIDNRAEELLETDNKALKLVMDACELKFPDETFEMAAFFYSLMYMNTESKEKAISEAARVLKPGGMLEVWDTEFPEPGGDGNDVYIANVLVNVNRRKIKTSYGVNIEGKHQTLEIICSLAEKSGITVKESSIDKDAFHIVGVK
jgi:ubiquinone/menaquinone biosynthesis C-methylase UbiE